MLFGDNTDTRSFETTALRSVGMTVIKYQNLVSAVWHFDVTRREFGSVVIKQKS